MKAQVHIKRKAVKEDQFMEAVTKVSALYYRDPRRFIAGVVVAVIAIVAIIWFIQSRSRPDPALDLGYTEALGYYSTGETQVAEQKFLELARRYPNKYLGAKSWYYLGNIYYATKRYNEARDAFDRFYRRSLKGSFLQLAGLMGLANSYEELGNYQEAMRRYERLYNLDHESSLAPYALLGVGRCRVALSDFTRAEQSLQTVVDSFSQTPAAEQARAQLAYVQALKTKF